MQSDAVSNKPCSLFAKIQLYFHQPNILTRKDNERQTKVVAILKKYDFSSKSQLAITAALRGMVVRMAFSTCCGA
jgi:hypothetical protein